MLWRPKKAEAMMTECAPTPFVGIRYDAFVQAYSTYQESCQSFSMRFREIRKHAHPLDILLCQYSRAPAAVTQKCLLSLLNQAM